MKRKKLMHMVLEKHRLPKTVDSKRKIKSGMKVERVITWVNHRPVMHLTIVLLIMIEAKTT